MKIPGKKKMIVASIVVITLGAALLPFVFSGAGVASTEKTVAKAALTVSSISPQSLEWPIKVVASGNVLAWQEASIGAELSGLSLINVRVNVGEHVRKGQVLALLNDKPVKAEIDQVKAGLREAEATYAEAHANAERARQIERSGALSTQQIAQYLTVEQAAAARVSSLQAQRKAVEIKLGQTRIVAPDDGTITVRNAALGTVVSPGNELFRLIRRDRLEWRAELPSVELARIKSGQVVRIISAGKNSILGKVRMVAPTIDQQTRNGLVYVDLQETADARSGMFARGEIELGKGTVMAIPQTALLQRDGFSYVFRVGQENRVVQTKVTVGQRVGDLVAITSGIGANTQVIESGIGFLADGDVVQLVPSQAKE